MLSNKLKALKRRVQELVDCYATTDPLKEMWVLKAEEGQEESPLKWLALAVLHGINAGAKEISVVKSADGAVRVLAEYWRAELPAPGPIIGEKIIYLLSEDLQENQELGDLRVLNPFRTAPLTL